MFVRVVFVIYFGLRTSVFRFFLFLAVVHGFALVKRCIYSFYCRLDETPMAIADLKAAHVTAPNSHGHDPDIRGSRQTDTLTFVVCPNGYIPLVQHIVPGLTDRGAFSNLVY